MLLKLVDELPSLTFPIQSPKRTGSIIGFSIYQAMGFSSVLDNGIETSIGFDKSMRKAVFLYCMVVSTVYNFMNLNLSKTNQTQSHPLEISLFWSVAIPHPPPLANHQLKMAVKLKENQIKTKNDQEKLLKEINQIESSSF
jgi:hypothetical protein